MQHFCSSPGVSTGKGESSTRQTSHTIRFDGSGTYPDGCFVAVDPCDRQPGGQVKHVLQNLLIEFKVGQLPLPLQRAQVDLVRGQVLGEPEERNQIEMLEKTHRLDLEWFSATLNQGNTSKRH